MFVLGLASGVFLNSIAALWHWRTEKRAWIRKVNKAMALRQDAVVRQAQADWAATYRRHR